MLAVATVAVDDNSNMVLSIRRHIAHYAARTATKLSEINA